MSRRLPTYDRIDLPTGLKFLRLSGTGENVSNEVLRHIAAIRNSLTRFGNVHSSGFSTVVDLNALYKGPRLHRSVQDTFMMSLQFFKQLQDFRENLLPSDFRVLLESFVEESDETTQETDTETDSENFTQQINLKSTRVIYAMLIEKAEQALDNHEDLVARFLEFQERILQNDSWYFDNFDQISEFVSDINDFEELLTEFREIFASKNLYIHPSRFMAGWEKQQISKAVSDFHGESEDFELTYPDDDFQLEILESDLGVTNLLEFIRSKLGGQIYYLSDMPDIATNAIFRCNTSLIQLIQLDEEESDLQVSKDIEDTTNATSFAYPHNLMSVNGFTLPYLPFAGSPEEHNYYVLKQISNIVPVKVAIISDPKNFKLAIKVVRDGGYAFFVGETREDTVELFASTIEEFEPESLERNRLIFVDFQTETESKPEIEPETESEEITIS
jgi:hypothetical protein